MVTPSYRILLTYSIQRGQHELYFNYMIREFVPTLNELNIKMKWAWHVYGQNQPHRHIEFICQDQETLRTALQSSAFQHAEEKLRSYTSTYKRKIVYFEERVQL